MSKSFLDTNILIYTADHRNKRKRDTARNLVKDIVRNGNGVISTQVMQEFYVAATKKLSIRALQAKKLLHGWENFEVVMVSPVMIRDAIDCSILNQLSFWDALIVMAAEKARCDLLYSEDLNHDQVINGVKIQNPFSSN